MNHYQILLFVLFVLLIVTINVPIWAFSESSEHELVWKIGSLVVSVMVAIGLILPNLTGTNQSEKSKTVVYILNTDGDIIETYEGVSGLVSNYTSISFDWGGKNYYFKNVSVKIVK